MEKKIRFISRLVGKSLNDLKGEVTNVMEAISPPLDNFDLVIDPFQLPGMNRILAVIQDSIPVAAQGFGKLFHSRMVHGTGQGTPFFKGFLGPCSRSISPDVLEFVFEDQDRIVDRFSIHWEDEGNAALFQGSFGYRSSHATQLFDCQHDVPGRGAMG